MISRLLIAQSEDEMPLKLTKDDKDWILGEIRDATNPQGWRKALRVLREVAPLGGILTVVLALIAIVVALGIGVVNRREVEATFRGRTEEKLSSIERQLIDLRVLVASSQPTNRQNQDAAREVLAEAAQKTIPLIPPPVVERAGKSFIDASISSPGAWGVATEFLAYRSKLNGFEFRLPEPRDRFSLPKTSYYVLAADNNPKSPTFFSFGGNVPQQDAFRAEPIDKPVPNEAEFGWRSFLIAGGAIKLDGMRYAHVVMTDVEIYYNGGPVILADVVFVNCRFVLGNDDRGRQLAQQILENSRLFWSA
jgi:hypothetical protein